MNCMRLLVCGVLAAALATAQVPNGAVHGVVVDSVTNQPIAEATVTLTGVVGPKQQYRVFTETTSAAGEFRFERPVSGDYELRAAKRGYVSGHYVGAPTETVRVSAGPTEQHVAILLMPTSSIEGRVLDESGRPLPGVALYARSASGSSVVPAVSGEDGSYRLFYLRPGSHRIAIKVPLELRRAAASRDPEAGERWTLASVQYYPGVDHPEAESAVHVEAGLRLTGVDVVLRRAPAVDFRVQLVDSITREVLQPAHVELSADENPFRDVGYDCRPADAAGSRAFELVPPGRYSVMVYRDGCGQGLPWVAALEVGARGPFEYEFAVPARVRIEGFVKPPEDAAADPRSLEVQLDRRMEGVRSREVQIPGKGRFVLEDVPPGPLSISVSGTSWLPKNWFVSEVRFGSQNALAGPVTVLEGGNPPLEIQLANDGGQISGHVVQGRSAGIVSLRDAGQRGRFTALPLDPDGSFTARGSRRANTRSVCRGDPLPAAPPNT
jgi:hypothetical protein